MATTGSSTRVAWLVTVLVALLTALLLLLSGYTGYAGLGVAVAGRLGRVGVGHLAQAFPIAIMLRRCRSEAPVRLTSLELGSAAADCRGKGMARSNYDPR